MVLNWLYLTVLCHINVAMLTAIPTTYTFLVFSQHHFVQCANRYNIIIFISQDSKWCGFGLCVILCVVSLYHGKLFMYFVGLVLGKRRMEISYHQIHVAYEETFKHSIAIWCKLIVFSFYNNCTQCC